MDIEESIIVSGGGGRGSSDPFPIQDSVIISMNGGLKGAQSRFLGHNYNSSAYNKRIDQSKYLYYRKDSNEETSSNNQIKRNLGDEPLLNQSEAPDSKRNLFLFESAEISNEVRDLSRLYNYDTVFKMEKISEAVINRFRHSKSNIRPKDYLKSQVSTAFQHTTERRTKTSSIMGLKKQERQLSKIVKTSKNMSLIVTDILKPEEVRTVNLDRYFGDEKPSRNHAHSVLSGIFFIYNNKGKVTVFMENLQDKICDFIIDIEDLLDPILYVIEESDEQCLLLVIGGYIKSPSGAVIPSNEISVFELSNKSQIRSAVFKIEMKYPRMSPIVFPYKSVISKIVDNTEKKVEEKFLLILGGNNAKYFSKKEVHGVDPHRINMSNEIVEVIKYQTLMQNLVTQAINQNKTRSLTIDFSLKLIINPNLLNTLSNAAVIRFQRGVYSEKTKKTTFILGVGKNKNVAIYVDYLALQENCIHLHYAFTKNFGCSNFNNTMALLYDEKIYYLPDDASTSLKTHSMKKGGKNNCGCQIF